MCICLRLHISSAANGCWLTNHKTLACMYACVSVSTPSRNVEVSSARIKRVMARPDSRSARTDSVAQVGSPSDYDYDLHNYS